MTSLQLASWNTRGLNGPVKRSACLDFLHRKNIDMAFVQESHLKAADAHRFANRFDCVAAYVSWFPHSFISLSINILEKSGSTDGQISLIKTIIEGYKIAFCLFTLLTCVTKNS